MRLLSALLATAALAACGGETSSPANNAAAGAAAAQPGANAVAGVRAGDGMRFDVRDFTGVALLGSDTVRVTTGADGFEVTATGDQAVLDVLQVSTREGRLVIARRDGSNVDGEATITVRMPTLVSATINGSGDLEVDRVEGGRLALALGGSGDLSVGTVRVDAVDVNLAGSGDISVSGTTGRANISLSGSGDVEAGGLTATAGGVVSAMGSGDIDVRIDGPVNVSTMGSGNVTVGGSPQCTVADSGGGGRVSCGS